MKTLRSLRLTVEMAPGTQIISHGIPDLIELANRIGCSVHAKCNDVLVMAAPGDDPIDLAVAWEHELGSKKEHKIAVAWQGRQHRVRAAAKQDAGS